MLEKHPLIRTIYLYLFTLVGLALLISGTVRFIDMGLKVFIFTKADDPERIQQRYYYPTPVSISKLETYETTGDLNDEEKATLKDFLANYEKWQEDEAKIDYLVSNRQREASNNLAMILVGFPLYFYHWRIIKKETKEKEN